MELFEKFTSYVLGALSGIAFGYVILGSETALPLIITSALIGMIISAEIQHHHVVAIIKRNIDLKDEIVALITHEMRTGLTSTNWAIQLVLEKYDSALSAEDKERLLGVERSIETTVMHSVNLLDVSLLEIEKLSISRTLMKLNEVENIFHEIIDKYTFGTKQKGINFTHDIRLDGNKMVEVDIMRIRIMIENLLENAMQYSNGVKKDLHVKIDNDVKNMNIMIKDTGIGIPKDEQSKIFSEFFRASNARKKLGSGSGIGLYMSKKYVIAHNGTIRFESEEGQGTTFFITLPLRNVEDLNKFLTKL